MTQVVGATTKLSTVPNVTVDLTSYYLYGSSPYTYKFLCKITFPFEIVCPGQTISINGLTWNYPGLTTDDKNKLSTLVSSITIPEQKTPTTIIDNIKLTTPVNLFVLDYLLKINGQNGTVTFVSSYLTYAMSVIPSTVGILVNKLVNLTANSNSNNNGIFTVLQTGSTSNSITVDNTSGTVNSVNTGLVEPIYSATFSSVGSYQISTTFYFNSLNRIFRIIATTTVGLFEGSNITLQPYDPQTDADVSTPIIAYFDGGVVYLTLKADTLNIPTPALSYKLSYNLSNPFGFETIGPVKYSGCIPDVDFIFANTTTYPTVLILPPPAQRTSGRLLYIKDKKYNALSKNISIQAPSDEIIDNVSNTSVTLNLNGSCLTLYTGKYTLSSSLQYLIANKYPSNNQSVLPSKVKTTVFNDKNTGNAILNSINFYDSTYYMSGSSQVTRATQINRVTLPVLSGSPATCMVIYSGNNTYSSNLNSPIYLAFKHDNNIDYGITDYPYIFTDNSSKNAGIYFISDGIYWYIVGWYYSSGWVWGTHYATSTIDNPVYNSLITNISTISTISTPLGNFARYRFPPLNTGNDNPSIFIIKNTSSNTNFKFEFSTRSIFTYACINTGNKLTDSTYLSLYYDLTTNPANHAYWFIARPLLVNGISYTIYYPLLCYTP